MFDRRAIMTRAWTLFRKFSSDSVSFGEALHRSWMVDKSASINSARISEAKEAAGITEECRTWSDWRKAGFEVIHGSKALFGCDLIYASKGDGAVYRARFFGESQVAALAAA